MRGDKLAKLTNPNYDHNPDALNQYKAGPKKKHAEYVGHMKNIEMFDNPHQMIAIALNNAGLTPEEVLQNFPKGYQLPPPTASQANMSKQGKVSNDADLNNLRRNAGL